MQKRNIGSYRWLPSGKCQLRISCGFDDYGKRLQFTKTVEAKSDRDAERLLMQFYNQRQKEASLRSSAIPDTLEKLYKEWMTNHVERNLAYYSKVFYAGLWERYLDKKGRLKLNNIKPKNLYELLDGVSFDRPKKGVYQLLNAMFNKAVKWGYMPDNPCNRIDAPKYEPDKGSVLSDRDLEIIEKYLPLEETKYQAIFYCATILGLRRQEIIGISWPKIDFTNNILYIKESAIHVKGKGTQTKETKTKSSERALALPGILKVIFLKMKNEQNIAIAKMGDLWQGEDWVFTQRSGKLMGIHTPSEWWKNFRTKYVISDVPIKNLRHSAATFMIMNNVPIPTVSAVLGHSKQSTTLNFYSHVLEDSKKDAISITENIIKTKKIKTV